MRYGPVTTDDLKSIWRIILTLFVCQLLGGAVGLAISDHHDSFKRFWIGGAAGSLPGFVLGVLWQLRMSKSNRSWIGIACLVGLLVVGVTVMAFGVILPRARLATRNLNELSQLQAETLTQIDVFGRYEEEKIATVTDPEALAAFAKGIADAVGHCPNHPRYTDTWHVVVKGTRCSEYTIHLNPKFPESVIGYIVVRSGDSALYLGTFESRGLRPWVETHLMGGDANELSPTNEPTAGGSI